MSRAKARVRSTLRGRLNAQARALRSAGVTLAQTAVAAGTAWLLAHPDLLVIDDVAGVLDEDGRRLVRAVLDGLT